MRIGRLTVPNLRLYPTVVDVVRRIYDRYSSDEADDLDSLAKLLGHSGAKSGAFLLKLSTLRAYGLVEGRGKIRLTETGRILASPTTREEEARAVEEAVKKIPLWRELYRRFGPELPQEGFTTILTELTGCSEEEAKEREEWVRRAYLDDTRPLRRRVEEKAGAGPMKAFCDYIELKAGDIYLKLPFDSSSLEVIKNTLDMLKKYLVKKEASHPS